MSANDIPDRELPSSQPILLRAVRLGVIAGLAQLVVMSIVGWLVDGQTGLFGALVGSALSIVFLSLTAASIAVANLFIKNDLYVVMFFVVVLGTWLIKFVAFIVAALLLRDQPWLNPTVLFVSIIVGVIISLIIDMLVVAKSRLPYVSDVKK